MSSSSPSTPRAAPSGPRRPTTRPSLATTPSAAPTFARRCRCASRVLRVLMANSAPQENKSGYIPIFLSEVPLLFTRKVLPLDVAFGALLSTGAVVRAHAYCPPQFRSRLPTSTASARSVPPSRSPSLRSSAPRRSSLRSTPPCPALTVRISSSHSAYRDAASRRRHRARQQV